MTTKTIAKTQAPVDVSLFAIAGAALAGIFLLLLAGFAQASVLHNSAHDTRHAIAFPCH
ncbi:MAG: CbtB domain-containing protein [Paracoccaceae bacterium]